MSDMPKVIWVKKHGVRFSVPGGPSRLIGGWDEDRDESATEYVRGDISDDLAFDRFGAFLSANDPKYGPPKEEGFYWVLVDEDDDEPSFSEWTGDFFLPYYLDDFRFLKDIAGYWPDRITPPTKPEGETE